MLGIVWAGLACLVQDDLKRLVAYSSIGHMGFVALAIATMSQTGIIAAVFGSVAHGLITGLLFFLAGSLKERYGTASLAALGRGLYGRAPWRAVALLFGGLATIGLPGLAGFWGEFLTLRAAFEPASLLPQTYSIVLMVIATAASSWRPPTSCGSSGCCFRASRLGSISTATCGVAKGSSSSPCSSPSLLWARSRG